MINFGVFYHHAWQGKRNNIPLPDLNYVRTDNHDEKAIDSFKTHCEAERRKDELNSRLHGNQTGVYYVAPTTQETGLTQKRIKINGSNLSRWK